MTDKPFLTDIKTLRERARKHIEAILAQEEEHAEDMAGLLKDLPADA